MFYISPTNTFKIFWDILIALMSIILMYAQSIDIFFHLKKSFCDDSYYNNFEIISVILYQIDIFLSFCSFSIDSEALVIPVQKTIIDSEKFFKLFWDIFIGLIVTVSLS